MTSNGRLLLSTLLALSVPPVWSQGLPPGFDETVAFAGVPQIIDFDWDSKGRLWVASKGGEVWLRHGGLASLALKLPVNDTNDSGISAIDVDPDFTTNHWVWIFYTTPEPSRNRLSRFVNVDDTLVDETPIFEHPESSAGYNGGCLRVLPDGTIFVATGYDGEPLSPQDTHNVKGKLLRLNPDGTASKNNPFLDGVAGDPRVWAYGLRNPFRCSLRPRTDSLFVGDVGSEVWEEIDVPVAGANLGFPLIEGPGTLGGRVQEPLYAFMHTGFAHAVIAGDFARKHDWSVEYEGDLIFGDHNADKLFRMRFDESGQFLLVEDWASWPPVQGRPVSIRFGPDGALYYVAWQAAELRKIEYVGGTGTGGGVSGLRIGKANGGGITLVWQASSMPGDTDYAIVEGVLPLFDGWTPRACSTGGKTLRTIAPSAGSTFYLVVPHNGVTLGSYGTNSDGAERVPSGRQCLPQRIMDRS